MQNDYPAVARAFRALVGAALCIPILACSPSAEQARTALERLGLSVETVTFVEAARTRGPSALALFLAAGLNPNRLSPQGGVSPLMGAASAGRAENAKLLIERGASVWQRSSSGETALHFGAANCASPQILDLLLEAGSDSNARDPNGVTPLMKFVGARAKNRACVMEMLTFLARNGARTDEEDARGNTALHIAIESGQVDVVSQLIRFGASVRHRDRQSGGTPLHRAARAGSAEIAVFLVQAGAELNAIDSSGKTPLQRAAGRPQVEATLRMFGAHEPPPSAPITFQ